MSNDDTIDIEEATISWDASRVVFTQTPDWILNNPNINDAAFRTWMTIAMHASNKNHTAFPSARKLMELRGKGRRVIFEHIRQLEAAGLLVREARYRANGGRTSSHYTLAWDRPLTPVQKSALAPGAEDRTAPDAENRAAPRATKRATRTRTTNELDPLPPRMRRSQSQLRRIHRRGLPPPAPPDLQEAEDGRTARTPGPWKLGVRRKPRCGSGRATCTEYWTTRSSSSLSKLTFEQRRSLRSKDAWRSMNPNNWQRSTMLEHRRE